MRYIYRVIHIYDVYEHEYIGNPPSIPRVLVATMQDAHEQRYACICIYVDIYTYECMNM